jgi:hypothetical protein
MEDLPPFDLPDLPDSELVEAYRHAAERNVLAAVNPEVFHGYWSVCADGVGFGHGNTYPSLDGNQMTEALLALGQVEVVLANWDYVRSFQRPDGLLPIAILPDLAGKPIGVDAHTSRVDPNGGLYRHWVPGDPLLALGATTYIQNAEAVFRWTQDRAWLRAQLPSVNLTAERLASMTTDEGAVGGAGYYLERPTRERYDGVTQCHASEAFRRLAELNRCAGDPDADARYLSLADRIADHFRSRFWVGDRFAEYLHPERGLVSHHGLTDVDWSALATGVADPEQIAVLWPRLREERRFYYGGMPTGIATRPEAYEDWEFSHPDRYDLAAMGRVWHVECRARARMGDGEGIVESLRRVCEVGRAGGYYWRERYRPDGRGGHLPSGASKYCEYPANLIRIVHRLLLGIEHGLDGSLTLAPTVPDCYRERGFGATLSWRGARLSWRFEKGRVTGDYAGETARNLRLTGRDRISGTEIAVTEHGRPVKVAREEKGLGIALPPAPRGRPFRFKVEGWGWPPVPGLSLSAS